MEPDSLGQSNRKKRNRNQKEMNNRKIKRILTAGTLFRVIGSNAVFMSLGGLHPGSNSIRSFNGLDIKERKPVTRADGRCRLATKKEQKLYWSIMQDITGNTNERFTIIHINTKE